MSFCVVPDQCNVLAYIWEHMLELTTYYFFFFPHMLVNLCAKSKKTNSLCRQFSGLLDFTLFLCRYTDGSHK